MKVVYHNIENFGDGSNDMAKLSWISQLVDRNDVVFLSEVMHTGEAMLQDLISKRKWNSMRCLYDYSHQMYVLSKQIRLMPEINAISIDEEPMIPHRVQDRFVGVWANQCLLIGVHLKSTSLKESVRFSSSFLNEQRQRSHAVFTISEVLRRHPRSPAIVLGDFNSVHNDNGILELLMGNTMMHAALGKVHKDLDHAFFNENVLIESARLVPSDLSSHASISLTFEMRLQRPTRIHFNPRKRKRWSPKKKPEERGPTVHQFVKR